MSNQNRKSIRLQDYDYSQAGEYFITICSRNRENIFGEVVDGEMVLNNRGKIIEKEILKTKKLRKNINIDISCIMPNHIHLIISILCDDKDCRGVLQYAPTGFVSPKNNLGSIIRGFKSSSTKQINIIRDTPLQPVFQRNYHEHIIRNQKSYNEIYNYILSNPQMWERDRNNLEIFKTSQ